MSVNLDRARNALLELAAADYVGLHEVATDIEYPDRVAAARSLVLEALEDHDAKLFRTTEWPPVQFEPIARQDWPHIVGTDESFVVPPDTAPPVMFWVTIGD